MLIMVLLTESCSCNREKQRDLDEMAELSEQLRALPVSSLNVVLEQTFVELNTGQTVKYSLSASTREAFFKFSKPPKNITPSQSSAGTTPNPEVEFETEQTRDSCCCQHAHSIWVTEIRALAHQNGPTERTNSLLIMNMATNLVETLETYKGISETFILRCTKKNGFGSQWGFSRDGVGAGTHC